MNITALLVFCAWGSYLNSLGYRLLHLEHFFKLRSFCPSCRSQIAWYDNLPILSWCLLKGRCRTCHQPISWLYPLVEIMTTIMLYTLWHSVDLIYFPAYFIFFSALIVTIRTDIDQMLISSYMTIYLIPIGFVSAYLDRLPISVKSAIFGTLLGYLILWITSKIHLLITQQEGIGQGDLELLACIGAFTGPLGCWIALTTGSIIGSIISIIYMMITGIKIHKVPFGAYLSLGAMLFILFQNSLISFLFA